MVSIPERRWMNLSEAVELVSSLTGVLADKAAEAIIGAGIDGQINAQGVGTYGSIIDPRLHRLDPYEWRADFSRWKESRIGELEGVEIERLSICSWLGLSADGTPKVPVAFAPQGKVTISHAVHRIRDRLHPRAAQRAVIEIKTDSGNELPASYQEHCENEADAEERLRLALHVGELVAQTEDGDTVDSDYWRPGNAGMTLSLGKLYTRHSSSDQWRKHHGRFCYLDEAKFQAWLDLVTAKSPGITPVAKATGAPATLTPELEGAIRGGEHVLSTGGQGRPSSRRRGRRPSHDWAAFQAEIARRVGNDPDGFPVVQADLEREMATWCQNEWGEDNCPSESTIREQVAQHYRRNDEADKSS